LPKIEKIYFIAQILIAKMLSINRPIVEPKIQIKNFYFTLRAQEITS